ncbi:MAG: sigma-54-dependent Fis family transcriptional regulator [Myxococcales bacterium]|nr:sigma-54-dependent Fis family transcriptional regulator [Myxococcales bacterium]
METLAASGLSNGSESKAPRRAIVVDDEPHEATLVCDLLAACGFEARQVFNGEHAMEMLAEDPDAIDVVFTDVYMAGLSGIELCSRLRARYPDIPVIVVTGQQSIDTAVAALRAGAYDFVMKPLSSEAVGAAAQRAAEWRRLKGEVMRLRQEVDAARPIDGFVGESPAIRRSIELLRRVANTDATVLISGESGTGKELAARALHGASNRAPHAFVAINCGAIPPTLLESELFGHVRGAFTDARQDRDGLFVEAGEGTVFLDEIGEMPLEMQVKLLRVLQERTVRPVGGNGEQAFRARVVCATNRDLETEVAEGRFREDLYYRVNVVQVALPPLRERAGDVLVLAQHILRKIATRSGREITGFSSEAARKLIEYNWPGNVRELENSLECAVALTRFNEIAVDDLPERIRHHKPGSLGVEADDPSTMITLNELEQRYVQRVLTAVGGNKSRAARILGIDRRSLYRRLTDNNGSSQQAPAAQHSSMHTA